ncbi:hypothetical protein P4S55_08140 [Shewanella sp. PP-Sp27a-2]
MILFFLWRDKAYHFQQLASSIPQLRVSQLLSEFWCNQKTSFDKMTEHLSEHQSTLLNYNFTDIGKEEMSKYIQGLNNCEQLDELIIAFKEPLSLIETFLLPE